MTQTPLTCAILAGGRSRRMGRDKSWIEWNGLPLIQHVIDRLQTGFPRILISANDPQYDRLGFPRVEDRLDEPCTLTGIHAVLSAVETDWAFICGCDMPKVSVPLIRKLLDKREGADLIIPRSPNGLEPLHALYARSCLPALEEAARIGAWKASEFPARVSAVIVNVEEVEPFMNVNTPSDLDEIPSP